MSRTYRVYKLEISWTYILNVLDYLSLRYIMHKLRSGKDRLKQKFLITRGLEDVDGFLLLTRMI